MTIGPEITAAVAAVQVATQQGRTAANASHGAHLSLEKAAEVARGEVDDFVRSYYGQRKFEPYLQFASQEDEDAFRQREAERKREIEQARAEGTPEGVLRANKLAIEQLKDAGAHGATASPDFQSMLDGLGGTESRLATALEQKVRVADANEVAPDPLADLDAPVALPPELLASLGAAGVALSDPAARGHGVANRTKAEGPVEGRSA